MGSKQAIETRRAAAMILKTLFVAVGALGYAGYAVTPLDEDPWPQVTPQYNSGKSRVLSSELRVNSQLTTLNSKLAKQFPKVSARMQMVNGSPEFVIDGKPTYMLWGVTSSHSPTGRHSDMPLNLVTIWSSSLRWHPETNRFEAAFLDGLAEKFCRAAPDAYFIWDLTVYPPKDWAAAHPGELVADEEGQRKESKHGKPLFSFASRAALDVMRAVLEKAIRHLESAPYANRIIGYRISSGDTPEWLAWTPRKGHAYDFSEPSVRAFRKWAAERYPELNAPHPPTYAERIDLDNGGDILWDQKRHLATIAFNEFYSDLSADACIELSVLAKKLVGPDKLVGTYHGYSHFLCVDGNAQHRALFAFKKVLDAKCIDFVCSPQSYSVRRLGEPFVDMKPFGTTMMNGILSVCENDARTHNGRMLVTHRYDQSLNAYQTVMKMRRDFATELCRRHPAYCYPIASFVGFDFPEMAAEGRVFRTVGQHLLDAGAPRRKAEVAYVVGERSITSLSPKWRGASSGELVQRYETNGTVVVEKTAPRNYPSFEIFSHGLSRWGRCGAPVDYVLAEDLKDNPGDYKLYVFAHNFKYDDAFRDAVARIRERGATLLWLYAPGWAHGTDCGTQCMKDLTGIDFAKTSSPMLAGVTMEGDGGRFMGLPGTQVSPLFYPLKPDKVLGRYSDGNPGLAEIRQGKSLSIFYGGWQMDQPFIRDVLKKAGVFVYCESNDPTEANEKLFTLHARYAGTKTVRLPHRTTVLDVFGRRIVARNADKFSFEAKLHTTYLFYLSDDADALLEKLHSAFLAPHSALKAEPIWWGADKQFHQGVLRDDTGAPKGKLLSDNAHWYGPAVFTGCTYEYGCDLYEKDEVVPRLNRFLRGKNDPPAKPVFGRKLLDGRTFDKDAGVVGAKGKAIKAAFDFKRPCTFTEIDFFCGGAMSYKGEVAFSDDAKTWGESVAFEGTQAVCRVRLDNSCRGRFMRFSLSPGEKNVRLPLDEVAVWGDGEVSAAYPEAGGVCDAPFTAPQSLRGIPETAMTDDMFADWQKRVGADVVVVPTRLYDPQRYSPITNTPPEKYRISMTKCEREMRYFAVANAGNGRTTVKIEKPDFGPDVEVEIWLGAVIHAQHPTRKLTEAQKRDLLVLTLEPPSDIGPINRMALEPFVRGDMKPQPNFIRRFCGNAEQLLCFPGAFPLEKGEAAVFMLRLTTKDAKPGVRTARLSAGRGRSLALELAVADATLANDELIVLMYAPFIGQFPYETETRRRLDVQFVNDLGVNFMGGATRFPKAGSKEMMWYASAPDKILRRKLLPGDGAHGGAYFPVSRGKKGRRVTEADLEAIVAHVGEVKAEAERLGIPKDRYVLDFPDEPRPDVLANLLAVARAVKAKHPDTMIFCNPLFFNGIVYTNETLMADLRATYNTCIDFSVPGFLAARRDWARNEFFTSAHRANMFYAQPARRMGRHGAWDAAVWGFNGFGYYCYWSPAIRCQSWDLRTNGASILGATYRMAYPSGDGFAITPLYEMMREAAEDFRLVRTLQKRGCGALIDELYKTTSTLRLEADFDGIHERLMAELLKSAPKAE